jgi:hypothetical protein
VLTGGSTDGPRYLPIVLEQVPEHADLAREEIFGPVTTLEPFDTLQEAITLANRTGGGIQPGIFTPNAARRPTCSATPSTSRPPQRRHAVRRNRRRRRRQRRRHLRHRRHDPDQDSAVRIARPDVSSPALAVGVNDGGRMTWTKGRDWTYRHVVQVPGWLRPQVWLLQAVVAMLSAHVEAVAHDVRRGRVVAAWNPLRDRRVGDRSLLDPVLLRRRRPGSYSASGSAATGAG